jgi:IS5 family transposase
MCLRPASHLFLKYIEVRGVRLKFGKVVDATLVEVPKQRNSASENEQVTNDDVPTEWESADNKPTFRQKDTDACWTQKRGISSFGYKHHTKIDQQIKFIESCVFTQAQVYVCHMVCDLLAPGNKRLYGDAAYWNKNIAERREEMGIQNGICEKEKRNTPRTKRQMETNATKRSIRSRVAPVYGNHEEKTQRHTAKMDRIPTECWSGPIHESHLS